MNDQSPVNPATLELVYQEAKDAHAKLMGDVDSIHSKADQITQVSLVVIGLFLAIAGSIVSVNRFAWLLPAIFISIILLCFSSSLALYAKLRGSFTAGTIYPHILQTQIDEPTDDVKEQLVDNLGRVYFYNLETLLNKSRLIGIAGIAQLLGIMIPVVAIIMEGIRITLELR